MRQPLQVNYLYIVRSIEFDTDNVPTRVSLDDGEGTEVSVPAHHVIHHMLWAQTRTCHSLQGASVSDGIIICDFDSPHVDAAFLYVALTRCRRLEDVYILAGRV
jgi:ATP-dependent exoDNAse (exonuclease V) alpha subunit